MKTFLPTLILGLLLFSCSKDDTVVSNPIDQQPEPKLLYYVTAEVNGKPLKIEYFDNDEPNEPYNYYPSNGASGPINGDIDHTIYSGQLTDLDGGLPSFEIELYNFINNSSISNYLEDYKYLDKIIYNGKFPFAKYDGDFGVNITIDIDGANYQSKSIKQDDESSYFKITDVEVLDEDYDGRLAFVVSGEFSCKAKEWFSNTQKKTVTIKNGKFKLLYSSFGEVK